MNPLDHLTVNTGHSMLIEKVGADIIKVLAPLVKQRGGSLDQFGNDFIGADVKFGDITTGGAAWSIEVNRAPVIYCALAANDTEREMYWGLIIELSKKSGRTKIPAQPKTTPWLATYILKPAAHYLSLAPYLSDFDQCLAWSIIDAIENGET